MAITYETPKIERTSGGIHDSSNKQPWAKGFLLNKELVYHPYLNIGEKFKLDLRKYPSLPTKYIRKP